MGITHAFAADITKAERDANGDLIVYGKATGPDVDLDEQICDPAWLRKAMPDWMTWGNLREMHQPIAAGVGLELAAEGDDWMVKSKVVDDRTAKKIEDGALKGYSVGIKNAQVVKDASAPGGRIVGGQIVEVSYVDRPCNPTATLAIAKAVGADSELKPVEAEPDDAGLSDDDRAKAIDLVKTIGPDGELDEQPDIEGGQQAITLIAKLISYEAAELAAGHLDEACDISLLVSAVECLKCWLAKEQGAQNGEDDDAISYVALAAKFGWTPAEVDAMPQEAKSALAALAKRDFSAQERRDAADSGAAMPDGSFPIHNREDLENAIKLAGHAKDPAAAKAHIKQRARALGAEDMIPDSWKTAEPDTTKTTEADLRKFVSKDEVNDLVKAAITKATEASEERFKALEAASEERVKALEAELAKVRATPIPGGPVVTATATTRQTRQSDDLNKAAYYEQMATQVQDPQAAAGYRQKAAEHRQKAAAGQSH